MMLIKDFLKELLMQIPICVFGNFLTVVIKPAVL